MPGRGRPNRARFGARHGASPIPRLRTALYQFMSPSSGYDGDWTPYSGLTMTGMAKGWGWQYYEQILRGRGYGDSSFLHDTSNNGFPSWRPVGEACLDFIGLFPDAFLGHGPPVSVLQEIHRRQARWGVPFRTKFYLTFINYESVNQRPESSAAFEPIRQVSKSHLLRASAVNPNTDQSYIDTYELYDSPPPPPSSSYLGSHSDLIPPDDDPSGSPPTSSIKHTWHARTNSAGYAGAWRNAIEDMLRGRYLLGDHFAVDGICIDNVHAWPYYGYATNTGLITPAFSANDYRAGWHQALGEIESVVLGDDYRGAFYDPFRWICNGGYGSSGMDAATYTWNEMPGRFGEFYLHATGQSQASKLWAVLDSDLRAHASSMLADPRRMLVINWTITTPLGNYGTPAGWAEVDRWALDPAGPGVQAGPRDVGDWNRYRRLLAELRLSDHVSVMSARGSSGFWIFWNPAFIHAKS